MRGKAGAERLRRKGGGITPACAGKRNTSSAWEQTERDHPRMCGEKRSRRHHLVAEQGSPPRMRGKGNAPLRVLPDPRITPACAGKRLRFLPACLHRQDHPRVCGEKSLLLGSSGSMGGSPPHMRGKVEGTLQALSNMRITPADAGKRHNRSYQQGLERGSPPHVRGKDPVLHLRQCL